MQPWPATPTLRAAWEEEAGPTNLLLSLSPLLFWQLESPPWHTACSLPASEEPEGTG